MSDEVYIYANAHDNLHSIYIYIPICLFYQTVNPCTFHIFIHLIGLALVLVQPLMLNAGRQTGDMRDELRYWKEDNYMWWPKKRIERYKPALYFSLVPTSSSQNTRQKE